MKVIIRFIRIKMTAVLSRITHISSKVREATKILPSPDRIRNRGRSASCIFVRTDGD